MKRFILVATLVFCSACCFAMATYRPASNLVIEVLLASDTVTPVGATVDRTIRLTNAGRKTVQIENVRKSCGCQSVSILDTTLEAGDSTDIGVSMSVRLQDSGTAKHILIEYRDAERKQLKVDVPVGKVVDALVSTNLVDYGLLTNHQRVQNNYLLHIDRRGLPTSLQDANLKIEVPDSGTQFFSVDEIRGKEPTTHLRVSLKPFEELPIGTFSERFAVSLENGSEQVSESVTIRGKVVRNAVTSHPEILLASWNKATEELGRVQVVRNAKPLTDLASVRLIGDVNDCLEVRVQGAYILVIRKPGVLLSTGSDANIDGSMRVRIAGSEELLNIPVVLHR